MLVKQFAAVGLALMLCLSTPLVTPAWAGCKVNSKSGGIQHGSVVAGSTVTVCGAAQQVEPGRKSSVVKIIAKPKVQAQPAPKQSVRQPNQYDQHRGWVVAPIKPKPKPVAKPKPAVKQVAKKSVKITAPKVSSNSGQAAFSVQKLVIRATPGVRVSVGQPVNFTTNAGTHFGRGVILGKSTEVRFLIKSVRWVIDGQIASSGAHLVKAFESEGANSVTAFATYAVAYRIAGSATWMDAGSDITSESDIQLEIFAYENEPAVVAMDSEVLLVGDLCETDSSVFGCG